MSLETSFTQAGVKANSQILESGKVGRLSHGGYVVLDFFLQSQIELVSEGQVVACQILALGFEFYGIFSHRLHLVKAAQLPFCCDSEVKVTENVGNSFFEGNLRL